MCYLKNNTEQFNNTENLNNLFCFASSTNIEIKFCCFFEKNIDTVMHMYSVPGSYKVHLYLFVEHAELNC